MLRVLRGDLLSISWGCVILDESHCIRTTHRGEEVPQTLAAMAASAKTMHCIMLSGTPSLCAPLDLFHQVDAPVVSHNFHPRPQTSLPLSLSPSVPLSLSPSLPLSLSPSLPLPPSLSLSLPPSALNNIQGSQSDPTILCTVGTGLQALDSQPSSALPCARSMRCGRRSWAPTRSHSTCITGPHQGGTEGHAGGLGS